MKPKSIKFVRMTLREAAQRVTEDLKKIYSPAESSNIADLVMGHITGFTRSEIIVNRNYSLSSQQKDALNKIAADLLTHKPVQYVLGETWFMGMRFFVDEHVLIPRPETEELVDLIVKNESGIEKKSSFKKILDIGTGSGCIATALKNLIPAYEVHAVDISHDALSVASKNAVLNNTEIKFHELNILDEHQWNTLPSFDIIVSNPPYIPFAEKESMSKNVVNFEPHIALFIENDDPLLFYRAIVRFADQKLNAGGGIFFEIHENAGRALRDEFAQYPITIIKDLQGKDRMLKLDKTSR